MSEHTVSWFELLGGRWATSCTCGWQGPVQDWQASDSLRAAAARRDAEEHAEKSHIKLVPERKPPPG